MALPTFDNHTNFAITLLDGGVAAGDLTITIDDETAFPAVPFRVVVWATTWGAPHLDANAEIMRVTLVTGKTWTVSRAQESTAAVSHLSGDAVALYITSGLLTAFEDAIISFAGDFIAVDDSNPPTADIGWADFDLYDVGHVAIGDAVLSDAIGLGLTATFDDLSGSVRGINVKTTLNPSAAVTAALQSYALRCAAYWDSDEDGGTDVNLYGILGNAETAAGARGDLLRGSGLRASVWHYGSGDIGKADVVYSLIRNDDSRTNYGDITLAYNYYAGCYTDKDIGIIIERYGLYVGDVSGGGRVTSQWGLYIAALTGADNNYGAYIGGPTQIDGILSLGAAPSGDDFQVEHVDDAVNTTNDYGGAKFSFTKTAGVTGYIDDMIGGSFRAALDQVGGVVGEIIGLYAEAEISNGSAGTGAQQTDIFALWAVADLNGGVVYDDTFGALIQVDQEAGCNNTGDIYGAMIWVDADGTVGGTVYMLYLDEASGADWALYHDGNAPSYFGGDVGLGATETIPVPPVGSDTTLELKGTVSPGIVWNDTGQARQYWAGARGTQWELSDDTTARILVDSTGYIGIGDPGGGDYSKVEADGTLVFIGAATVWNDANVGAVQLGKGSSAPGNVQVNASGVYLPGFDGVNTMEQLFGSIEVPHSYKEGTDITFHVHWMPEDGTAGDVVWQLEYYLLDTDDAAGAATSIKKTAAAPGVAWKLDVDSFVAISGVGLVIGTQLCFRFFRDPTDGDDDYGADALVATVGFHYEQDTVGSRQILTK